MSLGATLSRADAAADETAELETIEGFLDCSEADPLVKATQVQKAVRREETGGMSIVMAKQVNPPDVQLKGFFRKPAQSGVYRS